MSEAIGSTNLVSSASQTGTLTASVSATSTTGDESSGSFAATASSGNSLFSTTSLSSAPSLLSMETLLASIEEERAARDPAGQDAKDGRDSGGADGDETAGKDGGDDKDIQDPARLSEADLAQIRQLSLQDSKVRLNEEAHVRVGGQYASSHRPMIIETGPDNRQYAVSGEVSFNDTPIAGNPEATIRKLSIVKKAALAPAEPSTQDRAVANKASNGITQAQARLRAQQLQDRAEAASENAEAKLEQSRAESRARNEARNESLSAPDGASATDRPVPSTTEVQFAGPTPYDDGSITPQSAAKAFNNTGSLSTPASGGPPATSEVT